MTLVEINDQAEVLAKRYNPENISPFPYENILKENRDLEIYLVDFDAEISGAIGFNKERKKFEIFVNQNKPQVRQNFTTAHEIGHYFFHKAYIKKEEALVDGENYLDANPMLFR